MHCKGLADNAGVVYVFEDIDGEGGIYVYETYIQSDALFSVHKRKNGNQVLFEL